MRIYACLGALTITAGLVACSSSSKGSTSSPSTTGQSSGATTGAKATGTPIKLGLICGCSGAYGTEEQPNEDVYKAWVNTVNAAGGIDGHPIQLLTADDTTVPGTSVSDAQTFISDHVDAIVDDTIESPAWAADVTAAHIPVVGFLNSDTEFYTNADFYPVGETNDTQLYAIVATAKAAGATNLGVIYCAESPVCATLLPAMKADGQKVGLPVTFSSSIAATSPNYDAQCVAAQQAHVTALAVFDVTAPLIRLGTDCSQQGYKPIYVTEASGFSLEQAAAPGLKTGLWTEYDVTPYWSNTAQVQAMNAAVDKYYPGLRKSVTGWTQGVSQPWAGGLLLDAAIKAGGLTASETPSSGEIINGLDSLRGETLGGWSPPLSFTAGQPTHVNCWFTGRIQNGVPSLVNNGQTTCESGSSS